MKPPSQSTVLEQRDPGPGWSLLCTWADLWPDVYCPSFADHCWAIDDGPYDGDDHHITMDLWLQQFVDRVETAQSRGGTPYPLRARCPAPLPHLAFDPRGSVFYVPSEAVEHAPPGSPEHGVLLEWVQHIANDTEWSAFRGPDLSWTEHPSHRRTIHPPDDSPSAGPCDPRLDSHHPQPEALASDIVKAIERLALSAAHHRKKANAASQSGSSSGGVHASLAVSDETRIAVLTSIADESERVEIRRILTYTDAIARGLLKP